MEQDLQIKTITETDFVGSVSHTIYKGRAVFEIGNIGYSSDIEIYTAASGAYIKYNLDSNLSLSFEEIQFSGSLDDGTFIKGSVIGSAGLCISECNELQIGEFDKIQSIETILLGCYFQHKFSFEFKSKKITFLPSANSLSLAKRTKRLKYTILEGNKVVVEDESLSIEEVNQMLWVICWLLRPIIASEVYYKALNINDGELIIYSPNTPSGKRFGMREEIFMSTDSVPRYLRDGLTKWEKLDKFDRLTIKDAGYVLSNAKLLGYGELAIMPLFAAIERLGSKYDSVKPSPNNEINKIIKDLKGELKKTADTYFERNAGLSDEHQSNLLRSIGKIKPYDDQVIQKLKRHLINSNWKMEIDIDVYKELRDYIMHSGVWPKKDEDCFDDDIEDYPNQKSNDLQDQLEVIMLIAVLDLVGYEDLIEMSKNGWRTYVRVNDVKVGNME